MDIETKTKNIVDVASSAGNFETLCTAVKAAGLVETLQGTGPFTVFAPTDDAFAKLPTGAVEKLLEPENKEQLTSILTYHVVPCKAMASDVIEMSEAKTVNGQSVSISVENDIVMIDSAQVIQADIECSNGVIHVINSVIIPE